MILGGTAVVVPLVFTSQATRADDLHDTRPEITATVTSPGASSGDNGGGDEETSTPPPVTCQWVEFRAGEATAALFNRNEQIIDAHWVGNIVVEFEFYSIDNALQRYNVSRGEFERRVTRHCSDVDHPDHGEIAWLTVAPPDPAILIPAATRTATERIELPVPAVSPAGDVAVNLGMWLAVEPAGPYTARAAFNSAVWAETTATLVSTTFDPGDGSAPIVCDGFGTPIPDLDIVEPGPCGHVYADLADIGPRTMTISSTWQVTWQLSNGRSGRLDDIVTTTAHDFTVYEIQTVGVRG
jgi:hypothetical protein